LGGDEDIGRWVLRNIWWAAHKSQSKSILRETWQYALRGRRIGCGGGAGPTIFSPPTCTTPTNEAAPYTTLTG